MSSRAKRARKEAIPARPRPSKKRFALAALAGLALAAIAAFALLSDRARPARATEIPEAVTAGMEAPVQEIVAQARRGVLDHPDSANAWGWYAAVLDAHHFFKQAEPCYRRALELAPEDVRFSYNLAIVLESLGAEPDESLSLYRRFAEREPKFPPVHVRLGLLLARKGELEAAAQAHRRALELDPKLTLARRSLGQVLLALDDVAGAVRELERCVQEEPKDGPTHAALAQAYSRIGNEARAAEALRGAREFGLSMTLSDPVRFQVEQQGRSAQQASARAANRVLTGDYAGAVEDLKIVVRTRASDPSVHERLADAYQHLGQLELSRSHLAQARSLRGGN